MKILLINNLYEPYAEGGAEVVVKKQAEALLAIGHKVSVISASPGKGRLEEKDGIKAYYVRSGFFIWRKLPKALRLLWHLVAWFNIFSYYKIKKIAKQERPDLVIMHNLLGLGFLLPGLFNRLSIRNIYFLHDIQLLHPSGLMFWGEENKIKTLMSRAYQLLTKYLFRSVFLVVSPSQWLMDLYYDNDFFIDTQKAVLPNPGPSESLRKEFARSDKFKVLYVGQVGVHKGIDNLINAFTSLPDQDCELRIVGGRIKKVDDKRVVSLGRLSNVKALEEMSQADLLVVPSLCYENSPTVIYEAASMGLPVLASRLGGIIELLASLGGLFFEPGNESDLATKIQWCKNNRKDIAKIGQEARERIKEYDFEGYGERLMKVLNKGEF